MYCNNTTLVRRVASDLLNNGSCSVIVVVGLRCWALWVTNTSAEPVCWTSSSTVSSRLSHADMIHLFVSGICDCRYPNGEI